VKKLPKGLPPLPPVPAGFSAWEYAGKGPLNTPIAMGSYLAGGQIWEDPGQCDGDAGWHYIRAVKAPQTSTVRDEYMRFAQVTDREREIWKGVAEGLTNKELAARHGIAFKTVDNLRQNLMKKLQVNNMADLTRAAIRHGVITVEVLP